MIGEAVPENAAPKPLKVTWGYKDVKMADVTVKLENMTAEHVNLVEGLLLGLSREAPETHSYGTKQPVEIKARIYESDTGFLRDQLKRIEQEQ